MIRQEIINLIQRATGQNPEGIEVGHPENDSHGDYSTNIALRLKKNPQEIAEKLKSELFERVDVAGPGFINFFISKDYLRKEVKKVLKRGERFGQLTIKKKPKANIEFISANPTGPLHIGNGRNAFAGDVLSNILERGGYRVIREYFVNDARNSGQIRSLGRTALGKGDAYLSDYLKKKIEYLKPKIEKCEDESEAGPLLAREIQKDNKNFIENKLKIKLDKWVSEEDFYKKNRIKRTFDLLRKRGLVYRKEDAWWIKTSHFGDERDWVVIRKTGEPTYLLSDIAYHKDKIERGFDKIINIWGADHQAHVSKIKAAAKMLGYKGDLDILILQLVTLRGKEKISKRSSRIINLEALVDEIGLDVARFFYLQKSLNTHIEIDLALAKEQSEKNPVYYIQYAHARICSILEKAKGVKRNSKRHNLLNHPSELNLIKKLITFPEVIEDTVRDYQIQRVPQYAMGLATAFHQFYRDCQVISDDEGLTGARLDLILATRVTLRNVLSLMGISSPEKM